MVYGPGAFSRENENPDTEFYASPRMVHHLDATAREEISRVLGSLLVMPDPTVLDLMASWESHLPESLNASRVVGLGLNREEMLANPRLSEHVVHDLNVDPHLPFADSSFDAVLNTVSVDYLTRPFEVFAEASRVLKPGGICIVVFSNRMFPSKAVQVWRQAGEEERRLIVEDYLQCSAGFEDLGQFTSKGLPRPAGDKYEGLCATSDPVSAVWAYKPGGAPTVRPGVAPRTARVSDEVLAHRKAHTRETMTCPHCGERLQKWQVPLSPFSDWDTEFLHICFNDTCPFLVRGWSHNVQHGQGTGSYRLAYDRIRNAFLTLPVHSLQALKDGIVNEDGQGQGTNATTGR